MRIPRIRIDGVAFWQGFGLGAALGALGCIVFELWMRRIETGEIDPPEGYSEELKRETTVMADESAERLTLNRRFEKPALEDLVRNPGEETVHVDYSSYSSLTSDYSPDGEPPDSGTGDVEIAAEEASEGVSDVYRDEEGCTHEVVEEDSEVESRVFDIALSGDRELTPMERVQMHRRYQVITADQYENERPYNDKYECTYFPGEHILAGFDGDLRPVADNMLWGVVHDGMSVKGMTKMYIRDLEGDSDFLVGTDSRKYLDAYEDWYGEDPE